MFEYSELHTFGCKITLERSKIRIKISSLHRSHSWIQCCVRLPVVCDKPRFATIKHFYKYCTRHAYVVQMSVFPFCIELRCCPLALRGIRLVLFPNFVPVVFCHTHTVIHTASQKLSRSPFIIWVFCLVGQMSSESNGQKLKYRNPTIGGS